VVTGIITRKFPWEGCPGVVQGQLACQPSARRQAGARLQVLVTLVGAKQWAAVASGWPGGADLYFWERRGAGSGRNSSKGATGVWARGRTPRALVCLAPWALGGHRVTYLSVRVSSWWPRVSVGRPEPDPREFHSRRLAFVGVVRAAVVVRVAPSSGRKAGSGRGVGPPKLDPMRAGNTNLVAKRSNDGYRWFLRRVPEGLITISVAPTTWGGTLRRQWTSTFSWDLMKSLFRDTLLPLARFLMIPGGRPSWRIY